MEIGPKAGFDSVYIITLIRILFFCCLLLIGLLLPTDIVVHFYVVGLTLWVAYNPGISQLLG